MIKTDEVVYHTTTQKEYNWLMERLEEAGCRWVNGELPTKYDAWNKQGAKIGVCVKNKKIRQGLMEYFKAHQAYEKYAFCEVSKLINSHKDTTGKPRLSLVPPQIILDVAEVREYGQKKYPGEKDNWRTVSIDDYKDALLRHTLKYIQDPHGKDEESGIEHYKHMACNLAFICEIEANYGRNRHVKKQS